MSRSILIKIVLLSCLAVTGMGLLLNRAGANPNIVAFKTDTLLVDNDGDGNADPGDVIAYTITISNTGDMDAENVLFTDTIDANTTLVGGSLSVSPIARNDIYTATGNIQIDVPAVSGLLLNDVDPDGSGAVNVIAATGTSNQNGDF